MASSSRPDAMAQSQPQPWHQPEMLSPTEDFTSLWERHLASARKDFLTPSNNYNNNNRNNNNPDHNNNTMSDIDRLWDESYNSVLSTLEDLATTQSPPLSTHEASTQGTCSSTAPSSPSSPTFPLKPPIITISSPAHTSPVASDLPPPTPMIEIGGRRSKGKELASYYLKQKRSPQSSTFNHRTTYLATIPATPQQLAPPTQQSQPEPETPITSFRTLHHAQNPPPVEVHVLILTWAKHDRRGDDGQLLSPVLDIETDSVRNCFKRRGYKVQCRVIGEDYPTAAVETILGKFLQKAGEGRLLVVYYRGFGNLEGDGRMVFSSGFGGSYFFWEDVRDNIMLAEGEVVMVMDCLAAPGAEQHEILMEPGLVASNETKQLLGVCAPYGVGGGYMAGVMCRALDGEGMISVQGLCSRMREELRGEVVEESSVFVTQLGGGQLMDIYLPRFA